MSSRSALILTLSIIVASALPGCLLQSAVKKLMGPKPKQMVAMALDSPDPDVRREGINLLADRDWGRKEPYLKGFRSLLHTDKDPSVRAAAARALGRAGDPKYAIDLARALVDPSDNVRWNAASALDNVISDEAIQALKTRSTQDSSKDVRLCCTKALRHYPRTDVVKIYQLCLIDDSFAVRHCAHECLVEMTGQDLGTEPEDWADAANGKLPLSAPAKPTAPWWDFFKMTVD